MSRCRVVAQLPERDQRAVLRLIDSADITLARDFLSHAYRDNFDAAVLVAGDADFVPLVEEVKRLGKQVFVLFFPTQGLADELKRHADAFFSFETSFATAWANSGHVNPWVG